MEAQKINQDFNVRQVLETTMYEVHSFSLYFESSIKIFVGEK